MQALAKTLSKRCWEMIYFNGTLLSQDEVDLKDFYIVRMRKSSSIICESLKISCGGGNRAIEVAKWLHQIC